MKSRRRTTVWFTVLILVVGVLTSVGSTAVGADTRASAGVVLPRDEAPHKSPTEWWYFSGHLRAVDASGHVHHYGFEYVTFQFLGLAPQPLYFGNLAVTDLTRRHFSYAGRVDSYPTPDTTNSFDLHTGSWRMRGGNGHDELRAASPGYRLRLNLDTTGPATLHGTNGVIPYAPFGTSAYYSWTSLRTAGQLIDHGVAMRVTGLSWMDHQWGAIDFANGGGWDWFDIQLRDGRQYMLYFVRDSTGRVLETIGTQVGPDGLVSHLTASLIGEQPTGSWTSPATAITYSSGWNVRVPGGQLEIKPKLRDQEVDLLDLQGVAYWEGDVSVRGTIDGKSVGGVGYTEINPVAQG